MTGSPPPQKLAVAIIHGMGDQANPKDKPCSSMPRLARRIKRKFNCAARRQGLDIRAKDALAIELIYWADILQKPEKKLRERLKQSRGMGHLFTWCVLRKFMINHLGDPIAYRREAKEIPKGSIEKSYYVQVHRVVAEKLNILASPVTGAGPDAPLFVIGHSLGSVIASNYFYDLQNQYDQGYKDGATVPEDVSEVIAESQLSWGRTFTGFFTMGSPLALWSLMFPPANEHRPSQPLCLSGYHENEHHIDGEWVNFYAPNDIIGYPLANIEGYKKEDDEKEKVEDIIVRSYLPLYGASPFVHNIYWRHRKVVNSIAETLLDKWVMLNG